jgi:hypothetical protein
LPIRTIASPAARCPALTVSSAATPSAWTTCGARCEGAGCRRYSRRTLAIPLARWSMGEDLARWVAVAREEDVALRTRPRGGRDRSQTLRVSLRCLLLVVDLYAVHLLPFCVLFDFGRSKPDSGFSRPESRRARWRAGMTWDIKNQLDRTDSHRDDGMGCLAGSRSREYGFAGRQDLTAEVSKRLSWRSALYDELIVRRSRNRKGREIRRDVDDIVRQQVRDHHLHQRHV